MIRLISFEGGDGSGKTTQLRLLEGYLTARGKACIATREPGGTALGQMIRRLLLSADLAPSTLKPMAELFLYLADRAQHVEEVIQPALAQGQIVLCDRFTDSTLAYQGYGRKIDLKLLQRVNLMATRGIVPDLTIVLDCPVEVGLARKGRSIRASQPPSPAARRLGGDEARKREGEDRFEREGIEFHERVRQAFLELARAEPERICVVDAGRPVEEVHKEIIKIVEAKLGLAPINQ